MFFKVFASLALHLEGILGRLEGVLGRLGGVLEASWARLGSVLNSTSTSTSKSNRKPYKTNGFFTFLPPT